MLIIENQLIVEIEDSISAKPDYKVIDAEGNFNCNQKTFQLSFSIGQKDEGILMSIQKEET
mgnify:CR=1 FL=1